MLFLPFVFLSFYFNLNLIKISICRALPHRLNFDNCLIITVSGFIKYRLIVTISGIFNLLFWRRSAHHKLFLSGKDIKGICEHVTQRLCLSFSIATDNCLLGYLYMKFEIKNLLECHCHCLDFLTNGSNYL